MQPVKMHDDAEKTPSTTYSYNHSARQKYHDNKNGARELQKIFTSILIICSLVFLAWGGCKGLYPHSGIYVLAVDNRPIAYLTNEKEAQAAIKTCLDEAEAKSGANMVFKEKIAVRVAKPGDYQFISEEEAAQLLTENVTILLKATALQIDGREVAALATAEEAMQVIERVKHHYTELVEDRDQIIDVKLREEISTYPVEKKPEDITSPELAESLVLYGSSQQVSYEVESDDETLWTIAKNYDLPIEKLQTANPGLTSSDLEPGMVIKLAEADPILTVVVVKEVKETEPIAFTVSTVDNRDMLRGTEKVKTAGENGEQEITYQVVETNGVQTDKEKTGAIITKEPVEQVVERGTKIVVASRSGSSNTSKSSSTSLQGSTGGGGNGRLAWPVSGKISSRFGKRGREFHTGVDICNKKGTPIYAAESGKVIFASYSGGYGNLVKIDHGDGLHTWYAHMSKFSVKVGDSVSKGQQVGAIGTTGRTTGPHLHFEVRINGTAYNPLNYLR